MQTSSTNENSHSLTRIAGIGIDPSRLPVPLDSVIATQQLFTREARHPDYESESRALASLMEVMAESPDIILQNLVDTALELCHADSAGVSLLETDNGNDVFRWRATAGCWRRFAGGTMPRGASPCGTVLDRNASLLFARPQLHYDLPKDLNPEVVEALLVPFRVMGTSVGTIWVVSHEEKRLFDAEDWRLLASLGKFAANAYQILGGIAELDTANKAKVDFLEDLSHDARIPLNAIRGYVEIFDLGVHGTLTTEQKSDLARIRENAEFLGNMVDDVRSFATLEAGHCELKLADVNASELLDSVEALCQLSAREKDLSLKREASPSSDSLRADPQRLKQILVSLIFNAVRNSRPGSEISVSYSVDATTRSGCISVRDAGAGMSPYFAQHIFDPFLKVHTGDGGQPEGTGLALAISRKLARQMRGDITVSTGRGQGSTFTVSLPLCEMRSPDRAA